MSEDLVRNQLSYKLFVNHHFTEQSPLLSQMEKTYTDLRLRKEQYNKVSAEFPLKKKQKKNSARMLFSARKNVLRTSFGPENTIHKIKLRWPY